jgi:orotate phosphoribosyltransferase
MNWVKKFGEIGVMWKLNPDNHEGAHALLTSGNHSDGFVNCSKIAEDPALVSEVATALIEMVNEVLGDVKPEYVVGPAYGAITFAHEVARQLGVKFAFTEVAYTDEGKMQIMKRFDIPKGARVLVIEDVKSTGMSALKTIASLEELGIDVLPVVGLIINRSGDPTLGDKKVVALVDVKMNIYPEDGCSICKTGSEAVRPKGNWEKLAR